jgi:hypothetical protein
VPGLQGVAVPTNVNVQQSGNSQPANVSIPIPFAQFTWSSPRNSNEDVQPLSSSPESAIIPPAKAPLALLRDVSSARYRIRRAFEHRPLPPL